MAWPSGIRQCIQREARPIHINGSCSNCCVKRGLHVLFSRTRIGVIPKWDKIAPSLFKASLLYVPLTLPLAKLHPALTIPETLRCSCELFESDVIALWNVHCAPESFRKKKYPLIQCPLWERVCCSEWGYRIVAFEPRRMTSPCQSCN